MWVQRGMALLCDVSKECLVPYPGPAVGLASDRTHSAICTPEVIPSTAGLSDWEALLSLRLWSLGRGFLIDLGLVLQL